MAYKNKIASSCKLHKQMINLVLLLAICGCSSTSQEKKVTSSVPTIVDASTEGTRSSEITFSTHAPNWVVAIGVSNSPGGCKDIKSIGNLFYDAQSRGGGVLGFIQKNLNLIKPDEKLEIRYKVDPGKKLTVLTHATTWGAVNGYCGPVSVEFSIGEGRKYFGEFKLDGGRCWFELTDVTSAEYTETAVPTTQAYCKLDDLRRASEAVPSKSLNY